MGKADEAWQRLYDSVCRAQSAALVHIRPGMRFETVHAVAYEALKSDGLHTYFSHALGHGVGFAYHDDGILLAPEQTDLLEPGMVLTVEPGIYGKDKQRYSCE